MNYLHTKAASIIIISTIVTGLTSAALTSTAPPLSRVESFATKAERREAIRHLWNGGDPRTVIRLLEQFASAHPHIAEWIGYANMALGNERKAMAYYQNSRIGRPRLARANAAWFPPIMSDSLVNAHPGNLEQISFAASGLQDYSLPHALVSRDWILPPQSHSGGAVTTDPRHQWKFNRFIPVYLKSETGWKGLARVFYPSISLSGDQRNWTPVGQKVAHLLALCGHLMKRNLGYEPVVAKSHMLSYFLCPQGKPGSVTQSELSYIYAIGAPRSLLGLAREVGHEYSHHCVPAVGPLEGMHEQFGGGLLGERLLTLWIMEELEREQGQALLDDWAAAELRTHLAQTHAFEIAHVLNILANEGPENLVAESKMREFLGFALYVERSFGATVVRDGLELAKDQSFKGFIQGVEAALHRKLSGRGLTFYPRLIVPGNGNTPSVAALTGIPTLKLPSPASFLIWLPEGSSSLNIRHSHNTKIGVQLNSVPARIVEEPTATFIVTAPADGWHTLTLESKGTKPLHLETINFISMNGRNADGK